MCYYIVIIQLNLQSKKKLITTYRNWETYIRELFIIKVNNKKQNVIRIRHTKVLNM